MGLDNNKKLPHLVGLGRFAIGLDVDPVPNALVLVDMVTAFHAIQHETLSHEEPLEFGEAERAAAQQFFLQLADTRHPAPTYSSNPPSI